MTHTQKLLQELMQYMKDKCLVDGSILKKKCVCSQGGGLTSITVQESQNKLGVTARPLRCLCEESVTCNEATLRIEPFRLAFDPFLLEGRPLAADPHTAQV